MASDELLEYRDQILMRIAQLRSFLEVHGPVLSVLSTVGTVTRREERLKELNTIEVSTNSNASIDDIIKVLEDLRVEDMDALSRDSTKVTTKYPGLIVVPDGAEQLGIIIRSINDAKSEFSSAMKRVSNQKNLRFEEVHRTLPGLVAMHSTRKILFMESQLKKVTFAWRLNRNQEVKKPEQLISLLERRRAAQVKGAATTDLTVVSNIDRALHRLENHTLKDGEEYRLCRTNTFPVPIAHLFAYRPEGQERMGGKYAETDYSVVKASLPIFAVGKVPKVSFLNDWDPPKLEAPTNQRKLNHKYTELVSGADLGIFIIIKI
ncbi:DNA replication terminus site-binding protein [Photorhabdus tasmaniensis]